MMYALLALGFTMVYGIIELINFAHFNVFMSGTFFGLWFLAFLGYGRTASRWRAVRPILFLVGAFAVTMFLPGWLGAIFERLGFNRLPAVSATARLTPGSGGADLRRVLRLDVVHRGLPGRVARVYRGRAGWHRQHPWRGTGRIADWIRRIAQWPVHRQRLVRRRHLLNSDHCAGVPTQRT